MIEEPKLVSIAKDMRRPTQTQIDGFQNVPTGFVVDALYGTGALSSDIAAMGAGGDLDRAIAGPALTADNRPGDILSLLCCLKFIRKGDVLVSGFGAYQGVAAAGDRVTGMAKNCGAAGLVTDGPLRDYAGIKAVGLPCWATGLTPGSPVTNGPARVGLPLSIGGQTVETGDMIVADRDGVVVVPFAKIDATLAMLPKVAELETALDQDVTNGLKVPSNIQDLIDSDQTEYV
jgi:4-hydroxy-4-methyl-2-oxoglutarate aldolase